MANVYAGEVGVAWGERDYLFRPSLAAIASLGDPAYLVSLLRRIQSTGMDGYVAALAMLSACYVGDARDLDRLIGYFREHRGRLRYVMGSMPASDVHIIGARLAVNGMIGEPKRSSKGGKASSTFNPAEYVGAAQAHLGLSSAEAWQMTMLEFQRAMDAKFPPDEKDKERDAPSAEEAEAAVAHVMAMRAKKASQ